MNTLEKRLHSIAWWIAAIYGIACSCMFLIILCVLLFGHTTEPSPFKYGKYLASFWPGFLLLRLLLMQRAPTSAIKKTPNTRTLVCVLIAIVPILLVYPFVHTGFFLSAPVSFYMPALVTIVLMFGMNYLKIRELDSLTSSTTASVNHVTKKRSKVRQLGKFVCVLVHLIAKTMAVGYGTFGVLLSIGLMYLICCNGVMLMSLESIRAAGLLSFLELFRGPALTACSFTPPLVMVFYDANRRDQKASISKKIVVILAAIATLPTLTSFLITVIGWPGYGIDTIGLFTAVLILIVGLVPLQPWEATQADQEQLGADGQPEDGAHDDEPQQDVEGNDDNGTGADEPHDSQPQQSIHNSQSQQEAEGSTT